MVSIRTHWSSSRARRANRRASPEPLFAILLLAAGPASAALDLASASVDELDNGLTVLVLEDRTFPVASVQMLYRSGARDEVTGRTGLAHFVEHMAFRGSGNFPGTGLVGAIYAAGGEWHGYTYLDQTTYFATAPAGDLDLLLRIEADRMDRLTIDAADIPAEIGAVLAEMQGYQNDDAAVLHDATLFVSFLAHPYRNNTIGWASDVRSITAADVSDFYERHYHPGNAVLAIVGDVDRARVLERARELFGGFEGGPPSALPVTDEPPQSGVRRLRLEAPAERKRFQVAWHAPAANHPDFPALLLLQELLSGGAGVSFLQNDWGTPARDDAPLAGVTTDIATWLMPTAAPYVFVVKGSIGSGDDERALETRIGEAIAALGEIGKCDVARARERVVAELALDVQTTEDAAHELAFWAGIDALEVRRALPALLAAVEAADVRRVAAHYLAPAKRTIGWSVPGKSPAAAPVVTRDVPAPPASGNARDTKPAPAPEVARLTNGVPVILQPSSLSPTVHLEVVVPGRMTSTGGALVADRPVAGVTAYGRTVTAAELGSAVAEAAAVVAAAEPLPAPAAASGDPYDRIEALFARRMRAALQAQAAPLAIAVAGEFDRDAVLGWLDDRFGDAAPGSAGFPDATPPPPDEMTAHIPLPRAQARVGYIVRAPPPGDAAADAFRALAYILSHDYGGRLGDEAISRRGLVYYIDTRYRSNGRRAWITLSAGVAPGKLEAMRALLAAELRRLQAEPPTATEVAEALDHRRGRARSAHQANGELAAMLLEQWLWYGALQSARDLEARLARVGRDDVVAAVEAFTNGAIATVTVESQ